jgi:ribose transport system substrate-binding protein
MNKLKSLAFVFASLLFITILYQLKNSEKAEAAHDLEVARRAAPVGAWREGAKHLKFAVILADRSQLARQKDQIVYAKKLLPNMDADLLVPTAATAAAQKVILDDIEGKGYAGIVIVPADPEHQAAMIDEAAAHCLVFTQDRDVPESKRACFVGHNPFTTGQMFGRQLLRAGSGGKVFVLDVDSKAPESRAAIRGLNDALKGTRWAFAEALYDEGSDRVAEANVRKLIADGPQVAGIVALSERSSRVLAKIWPGASGTKIVTLGTGRALLDRMKAGAIFATQHIESILYTSTSLINMFKHLNGDRSAIPENKNWAFTLNFMDQGAATRTPPEGP